MKIKELRKKNNAELVAELAEKRKALVDLRFGSSANKIKNMKSGRNFKKDIAQIITLIAEMKKNQK